MTKVCNVCRQEKPIIEFGRHRRSKDGFDWKCKECNRATAKRWAEQNAERNRERARQWAQANPGVVAARVKRWRDENPDKYRPQAIKCCADRLAAKLNRTIKLSPEHKTAIKRIYAFSAYMTKKFGTQYHVDHIVPMRGETVSGLHVPWNLQVVPASTNIAKSNKLDYSRAQPTCMD